MSTILHIDADAFFASVECALEPRYRGKPLIVGGGSRGVVASASYEARKFGIRSAMPIYKARKLCPNGIFIKGNHGQYVEFSKEMFRIFRQFTPTVEITSIDEGYLDLKGTEQLHKADPFTIAGRILKTVHQKLNITLSGGLSTSKVVSKIAASIFKPRQLSWIFPGKEEDFLKPLPIESMPGIGPKTAETLKKRGIKILGDIAALTFDQMWDWMGGYGMLLWERAHGIDRSPVQPHAAVRKSISEENTFERDITNDEILMREAYKMLKSLCFRLRKKSLFAKTLTLKIRYRDFQTVTHQATLERPSNIEKDCLPELKALFQHKQRGRAVRLIGVGLSHLQNRVQLELFGSEQNEKQIRLQTALDGLRGKYGEEII